MAAYKFNDRSVPLCIFLYTPLLTRCVTSPWHAIMSEAAKQAQKAVPAQLGFLAIYNPSLGSTDDTIDDQIVYYNSPQTPSRRPRKDGKTSADDIDIAREWKNEQLRQIGLAQGMVEFGRSFADGKSVDTIETEKSRIILHELESGWWILAVSRIIFFDSCTC